jgi:uncharacterized phage protein (TIGR02218 family)
LLAHLAQPRTQLAEGWLVERVDGQVFGFCSLDQDVTIAGVTYRATGGLKPSSSHNTDDLSVNTMDVTVFLDVSTEQEIAAGIWDNATVTCFEFQWSNPPTALDDNVLIKRYGQVGTMRRQKGVLLAEIQGLAQRLAVRTGRQYSPGCPWRLGSVECGVDLTPYTHTGTITSVGAEATREFSDLGAGQPDGYYAEGWITMRSGANATITREVRAYSGGQFSLYFPFSFPVQVGDQYQAIRGDDKTKDTCKTVFNNYVNFGGYPDLPGIDQVFANPTGL